MKSPLYSQLLIKASRDAEFSGPPPPDIRPQYREGAGHNPLCGDKVEWYAEVDTAHERLGEIRFQACGCMMCKASAGFLARALRHKPLEEARAVYEEVRRITDKTETDAPDEADAHPEKPWRALSQIRAYPARRKCVMMPWNSFFEMLKQEADPPK